MKASSWQGFGGGTGARLRQQGEEAEMAFVENKSLSQHVNENHSAQVASPRHCRQHYGIKIQTFKNQRDVTLLSVPVKHCAGSLPLLRGSKRLLKQPWLRGERMASLALSLPAEPIPNALLTDFLSVSALHLEVAEDDLGRLPCLSDRDLYSPSWCPGDKPIPSHLVPSDLQQWAEIASWGAEAKAHSVCAFMHSHRVVFTSPCGREWGSRSQGSGNVSHPSPSRVLFWGGYSNTAGGMRRAGHWYGKPWEASPGHERLGKGIVTLRTCQEIVVDPDL